MSETHKEPTNADWATGVVSCALLLSALANEETFSYVVGMAALGFFAVYLLTTGGLLVANARGRIPAGAAVVFDLGRLRVPVYVLGLVVFGSVLATLLLLPDFRPNATVFVITMAIAAVWWVLVLRRRIARADAGPQYALNRSEHSASSTAASA